MHFVVNNSHVHVVFIWVVVNVGLLFFFFFFLDLVPFINVVLQVND